MPTDPSGHDALEQENERLKSSLKQCNAMLDEYRSKMAADANGDYRPPYETDNGQTVSPGNDAS